MYSYGFLGLPVLKRLFCWNCEYSGMTAHDSEIFPPFLSDHTTADCRCQDIGQNVRAGSQMEHKHDSENHCCSFFAAIKHFIYVPPSGYRGNLWRSKSLLHVKPQVLT